MEPPAAPLLVFPSLTMLMLTSPPPEPETPEVEVLLTDIPPPPPLEDMEDLVMVMLPPPEPEPPSISKVVIFLVVVTSISISSWISYLHVYYVQSQASFMLVRLRKVSADEEEFFESRERDREGRQECKIKSVGAQ